MLHYSGTPLIRSPMGQMKLAVLTGERINEGFFLYKKMYSRFVRRPKSGLNNEVTVLPSGSKASSFTVQFSGHWLHSGQVDMFVLVFFAPLP